MQTGKGNLRAEARGFPRANSRFESHEIDDELVLQDTATGAVHILNGTAAAVWWLCDGKRSCDEIVAQIARLYQQDVEDVDDDVRDILSQLIQIRAVSQG